MKPKLFTAFSDRLPLLLALALSAGVGAATEPDPDACADPQTTAAQLHCARAQFADADRALNDAYRELLAVLDPDRAAQLRAAQRAWVAFRDAEAQFAGAAMAGGSLQPVLEIMAMSSLSAQRTAALRVARQEAMER